MGLDKLILSPGAKYYQNILDSIRSMCNSIRIHSGVTGPQKEPGKIWTNENNNLRKPTELN